MYCCMGEATAFTPIQRRSLEELIISLLIFAGPWQLRAQRAQARHIATAVWTVTFCCGYALQGRDSGSIQRLLTLELHATHSAFGATEAKEKGSLHMGGCREPGGGPRPEGVCKAVRSVESHGSANGEASPEPEGSLRRTALAFSRCKARLTSTSRQWQMSGLVRKWCRALAAKENANADAPTSPAASQGSFKY